MQRKRKAKTVKEADQMLLGERRQHILAVVQAEGRALVGDLSRKLGISQITIRKDLDYLQSRGLIERTHGGALPAPVGAMADPTIQQKEKQHHQEKVRIAAAAAKLVQEGQCIMLDSGTTTTALARTLRKFNTLTVITNAVNIAAELAGTDIEVIMTGGTLRKTPFLWWVRWQRTFFGRCMQTYFFWEWTEFDVHVGPTTPNVSESRVNRIMVDSSKYVVALCDSTKFKRQSLARIVPTVSIHQVITDKGISNEDVEVVRSMNIEVTLV
jgi:DeoR family transcriptional regulator, aga operon transcriptional repressor